MNQQTEPKSNAKQKSVAVVLLILTTIIWGSTFIITNIVTQIIPPMFYMGVRYLIGFIAFIPFLGRLKTFTKKQFKIAFIAGTLCWISFALQTVGIMLTTATKSAFITGLNVIMIPIFLAIFFKKEVSKKIWISTFFALVGVSILSFGGIEKPSIGDLLVLICDIFYALYVIYLGIHLKEIDTIGISAIIVFIISFFSFISSFIFEDMQYIFGEGASSIFTYQNLGIMLYMGLIATTISNLTQNYGQTHISPTKTAIIFSLEPLFATFFAILGKESLNLQIVIGAILIFTGIVLSIEKKANSDFILDKR